MVKCLVFYKQAALSYIIPETLSPRRQFKSLVTLPLVQGRPQKGSGSPENGQSVCPSTPHSAGWKRLPESLEMIFYISVIGFSDFIQEVQRAAWEHARKEANLGEGVLSSFWIKNVLFYKVINTFIKL